MGVYKKNLCSPQSGPRIFLLSPLLPIDPNLENKSYFANFPLFDLPFSHKKIRGGVRAYPPPPLKTPLIIFVYYSFRFGEFPGDFVSTPATPAPGHFTVQGQQGTI